MTYQEAIAAGYHDADLQYQRGYVSRHIHLDEQEVYTAGGRRKGDLYVLIPAFNTTQYCLRQYLTK